MIKPIERLHTGANKKTIALYQQLQDLMMALDEEMLTAETIELIDQQIIGLNAIDETEKNFQQSIRNTERNIIKLLEKRHRLVPRNHYRKLWMILGMSSFGIPVGMIFGLSIKNLSLIGMGIPIGMVLGIGIGKRMDEQAFKEGRQLNFESKH